MLMLGLGGALGATRLMKNMLFLTSPNDPGVFAAVTAMLVAIGVGFVFLAMRVIARREYVLEQ